MSWLSKCFIKLKKDLDPIKTIIDDEKDICIFSEWYCKTLLDTKFKISTIMNIVTIQDLLCFILKDGEVMRCTTIIAIRQNICNNKINNNKTKTKTFIDKTNISKTSKMVPVQRKYMCNVGNKKTVLNDIIKKMKVIINDNDNVTNKKLNIMVLEHEYLACDADIDDEIVKRNYNLFIREINKLDVKINKVKTLEYDQTFTPMKIVSITELVLSKRN
jgi:hypothetical protein